MQTIGTVTKPTKQRKMLFQAPDHIRYKLFAAPLSPELKATHAVKALPVRSGDSVRIMRGDHQGFEGKITRVNRKEYRIYVEGLTREKVDGTTVFVPIHPSKVMITRLNLEDKWRKKILERKKVAGKKIEEVAKKPAKEVVEIKEEVIEEKPPKKPPKKKSRKRKKVVKKPKAEKVEEKAEEAEKEEKPKAKKRSSKSKAAKKTEGET
jgi:large subunit ribosomal protein L24